MNHKNATVIHLEEISPAIPKNSPVDYKISQQSSISSNNLLRPDSNPWNANTNDGDLSKLKSPSISNIAGR